MPIYEFECNACSHRFSEFFRRMISSAQEPAPPCPVCHSTDTRRVVSSFAQHGGGEAGGGAADGARAAEEAPPPKQPAVTPKEQIDRWRAKKP